MQVWSKSTIRFRRYRVQTMLIFTVFIVWWPSKLGQGHRNLINSFNYPNDTLHKVWPESIIGSRDRVQTSFFRQNLTFKVPVCPWKWGQGHQNINISSPCPSGVSMQNWSKFTKWFRRWNADKAHFYSLYSVVTLKIRSRSQKSDQIFKPSQYYNVWSLVIIRHFVQEIGCRQYFLGQNLKFLQSL